MIAAEIIPRNPKVMGYDFRMTHMYNLKTDEILRKNEALIKQIQEPYFNTAKKFIIIDDCRKMLAKAELTGKININKITTFFAESL